jgi:uncharacterized membrane protein
VDSLGNPSEPGGPGSEAGDAVLEAEVTLTARLGRYLRAVRDGDEAMVEDAILQLSRSRRLFAPLAFMVGGIVTLFDGLKLLFSNWRLTLVQILPAMWVWVAMLDWKAHVLHGDSFHVLRGPILIPIMLAIVALTAASFYLNAVFGFAISGPAPPQVRPAFARARTHLASILVPGVVVGLLLGFSTTVITRWGHPWFAISLGVVVGVMMVCYVAVPARLIGVKKPVRSRREKLTITAVAGAMGAVVSAPPYVLGRIAMLMLGTDLLLIPGVVLLTVAAMLQAGATGAVKAVKMSTSLTAPRSAGDRDPVDSPDTPVECSGNP